MMSANTEDVEMRDVEDDEDEEDAVAEELGTSAKYIIVWLGSPIAFTDKSEDEEEVEDYPEDEDEDEPKMPEGRNKHLTVGYKGDRSYVVRGN